MQGKPAFLDDLSKMASGAAGAMLDMKRELEQTAGEQIKRALGRMELVSREEFERVKAMAEKAREENIALAARLEALEKASKPAKATAAKKT